MKSLFLSLLLFIVSGVSLQAQSTRAEYERLLRPVVATVVMLHNHFAANGQVDANSFQPAGIAKQDFKTYNANLRNLLQRLENDLGVFIVMHGNVTSYQALVSLVMQELMLDDDRPLQLTWDARALIQTIMVRGMLRVTLHQHNQHAQQAQRALEAELRLNRIVEVEQQLIQHLIAYLNGYVTAEDQYFGYSHAEGAAKITSFWQSAVAITHCLDLLKPLHVRRGIEGDNQGLIQAWHYVQQTELNAHASLAALQAATAESQTAIAKDSQRAIITYPTGQAAALELLTLGRYPATAGLQAAQQFTANFPPALFGTLPISFMTQSGSITPDVVGKMGLGLQLQLH